MGTEIYYIIENTRLAKQLTNNSITYHVDSTHSSSADILELLSKAASCYATAIHITSKDINGHIGLGLAMEELFYIEDLYGHKPTEVHYNNTVLLQILVCSLEMEMMMRLKQRERQKRKSF